MGASCWTYFVLYQEDIEQALQDLRNKVFEAGEYQRYWLEFEIPEEGYDALDEISWTGTDQQLVEKVAQLLRQKQINVNIPKPPQTIKEALERNEAEGTHSILDIEHISSQYENGAATLLSREMLCQYFGVDKPTRSSIELNIDKSKLFLDIERWQAIYCIVYKDNRPDELFFAGCTGG